MTWTLAPAIATQRAELNARWPHRDHASDGTIGDARHQSEGSASDHNPWLHDTVRAEDIDTDGIDAAWLAEHVRQLGAAGDRRLTGGGYVIHAGRIASDVAGWAWRPYAGTDGHTGHIHVSVSRDPAGYSTSAPWGIATARPAPAAAPPPGRGAGLRVDGDFGLATVRALQRAVHVRDDGDFGPATKRALQQLLGVRSDGVFGPVSTSALQARLRVPQSGRLDDATVRALQQRLNVAGTL